MEFSFLLRAENFRYFSHLYGMLHENLIVKAKQEHPYNDEIYCPCHVFQCACRLWAK